MSYQTRNILILSVIAVLITCIGGYFVFFVNPSKIDKSSKTLMDLRSRISALEGTENEFVQVKEGIEEREARFASMDKTIVQHVPTAKTYEYLTQILQQTGFFKFSVRYKNSKEAGTYGYNTFQINGEGSFDNIYELISYLERGPQLYKVRNVKLTGMERAGNGKASKLLIPFQMEIWAYYANISDIPINNRRLKDVEISGLRNPFKPLVSRKIPANVSGLLDVQRGELKALVADKALIAGPSGKMHELREGDRVYLGYLTRIDFQRNFAEFTLNKGGIVEKFVLRLKFDRNRVEF